ncbi:MAG: hypothetical protein M1822_003152 [Bathelium mastoideum]|nr:MAG: hypothetical protein M1822_003152 [Bathelium mastoideum]
MAYQLGEPSTAHISLDLERQLEFKHEVEPPAPKTLLRSTAFLDGLRGLAALFVLIQHYIGHFDGNVHEHGFGENGNYSFASLPFLRIVFSGGSAAVAIFFVLSGYVLSRSALVHAREGKRDACAMSLVSAVVRRPIRLYVPTLCVTFAIAILMHAPFGALAEVSWAPPKESLAAEIGNWTMESVKFFNPFQLHGSNKAWYTYDLVVWTIPIELKGSMLIYALTAACIFSGLPVFWSVLLLDLTMMVLLQLGRWTMGCFIGGLILSYLDTYSLDTGFLSWYLTQRTQTIIRHVVFVAGYYLLCQPAHDGHPEYSLDTPGWYYLTLLTPQGYDQNQYYRYWHSWGAYMMVYAALRIEWLQQFLNTRPLRYLGKVSFMLYLIHLAILNIVGDAVARMLGQVYPTTEESWVNSLLYIPDIGPAGLSSRFLLSLAVTLSVCLVVADVGTRLLDIPSVHFGKWLVQRLGLSVKASP